MKPKKQATARIAAPNHLRIGEYHEAYGGAYAGIMRGAPGKPDYHLFVAMGNEARDIKFGPRGANVAATSDLDGAANTSALCSHEKQHPAARWAADVSLDGFHDFYLPARHELRLCYLNVPELFDKDAWYWSSTQHAGTSHGAWYQTFSTGNSYIYHKHFEGRARAVRRLII